MPTIYLISYSSDAVMNWAGEPYRHYKEVLRAVPRHALQLSSVACSSFTYPSLANGRRRRVLDAVFGEICMQDVNAQKAVEDAASEAREAMGKGAKTMLVEVECTGDAMRSRAVAEVLKEELESFGVDVELEHIRGK
ncbi:hypothetical protein K491DRAFT_689089 [Lophiostoma macrostomum CBS 122681]|uniref:Uncharacterized protein n=1 Tax=Lophiostoma macrostomum CBS 122681 TaxID=1314788 RepID=A0A6A6TKL3_9PLEO|nr:hypothetical protein K491DRAFT_689089 [Lophiostoma macrostomum CBS 122681]